MTILVGKTLIDRFISLCQARQSLGAVFLRQDDRMLDDIGLTRSDLSREIGSWQDRAEIARPVRRRAVAATSTVQPAGSGLAGLTLPRAAIRETLMLRRAA